MRIRTKLILLLLFIGIVELVYLDQYWIPASTENDDKLKQERIIERVDVLSAVLINPIQEKNIPKITQRLGMAFAMREDWISISVSDKDNKLLFSGKNEWRHSGAFGDQKSDPVTVLSTKNKIQGSGKKGKTSQVALSKMVQSVINEKLTLTKKYKHEILNNKNLIGYIHLEYDMGYDSMPQHRNWEVLLIWNILGAIVIVTILFETQIIRPTSRIARAIWASASGDYNVRLPRGRNDEIGSLITSFRMMRDSVQKREVLQSGTAERMQSIFDRAVDGIFLSDHTGVVETLNPSAQRMLGCKKGQGVGENIETFIPGIKSRIDSGDFHSIEDTQLGGNAHPVIPTEGFTVDRKKFSLELGISRLVHGNKVKYIGVFRDVTKRAQMEQQLAEYTSELEAKNVLLDHALEDIRAASRAKTEFLANTSDEIRTPMNGVLGMLTILKQESLNDKQTELLDTAMSSGNALLAVMNDVLDFSKIESGKLDFEYINFDMRRVVEELCRIYERVVIDKPVTISCIISPSVPSIVCGDPTRFRQILNNLLSNAVKYTDKGEIIVRADHVGEDSQGNILEIQISDTGLGMPEERRQVISDGFSKSAVDHTNLQASSNGMGLGLNVCRRLVDMFDGEIGLKSEDGKGCTFWFTIHSKCVEEHLPKFKPLEDIKGLRVMCVDDNHTSLEILERVLETKEILCTTETGAEDGLKELRNAVVQGSPYDVAIIDRNMPGMDGIELAKVIREDPVLANMKLVLLTSVSVRGDGKLARDSGFNGYFTKPISQAQIYDCIATVMGVTENAEDPVLVTRHTLQEKDYRARRILLVEDNVINQKVALGLLLKLGYHADVSTNGQEAVTASSKVRYDAIIMDCEMPVMSGYQATQLIREREEVNGLPPVPIIALTAHAATGYKDKCLKSGMNDHLSKPVRLEHLQDTLDRWLLAAEGTVGIKLK